MIEDAIYTKLCGIEGLSGFLATFNEEPAIFYQQAPNDKDANWTGSQYPRADYLVQWQANPERKTAGTIEVNVYCLHDGPTDPEDLTAIIEAELSEQFYTNELQGTFCSIWQRTDAFDMQKNENEPLISGATMLFDIIAFPDQGSSAPDPCAALASWIAARIPNSTIIGKTVIPELWKPTDENPAVYVRIGENSIIANRSSYAVSWLQAGMACHIIAPTPGGRQKWLKAIAEQAALDAEALMADGSPLFFQQIKYLASADYLKVGQMTITAEYGVLRAEPDSIPLTTITITDKEAPNG